jgi:hypothetical protein
MLNNRKDIPEETWAILATISFINEVKQIKESKISQQQSEAKKKVEALIEYWIIDRWSYNVLKNWWKYDRKPMTDKEILDYSMDYHKKLWVEWMLEHILNKLEKH